MILVLFVMLALALTLLRGGNLENLSRVSFRWGALILLSLLGQILIFNPTAAAILSPTTVAVAYNLTMIMLLVALLRNARLPGVPLMALGIFLNWLAITVNGGFMPASAEALRSAGLLTESRMAEGVPHYNSILLTEQSRLPFLTDIMAIPAPLPLANVFSVGDLLLGLGAFLFLYRTLMAGQTEQQAPMGAGVRR